MNLYDITCIGTRCVSHLVPRQTVGTLNLVDFKFLNPLEILILPFQLYYIAAP